MYYYFIYILRARYIRCKQAAAFSIKLKQRITMPRFCGKLVWQAHGMEIPDFDQPMTRISKDTLFILVAYLREMCIDIIRVALSTYFSL